jgi:PAS domain S-box-containing protein
MRSVAGEPAVVVVRADGTYLDANDAALEIFGVSRDAFLASKSSDWTEDQPDPNADTAFREQWAAAGEPDLGGAVTIVRRDGQRRRVRFVITRGPDDEYVAVLEPLPEPTTNPTVLFTAGSVLAEWRAAERRLEAVPADSPEWQATAERIQVLREQYHRLFDARRG